MNVDRLLAVSMWTNLAYVYDRVADNFVNTVSYSESDSTPLHALDDIVTDPLSGNLYVFHRRYQSNTHRLGVFDPVTGVADIGDTGISFHDSTFATDGTLYAVGRDATLYSVNTSTAAVTPLCNTGYGSSKGTHSALAWDPTAQELLQIIDEQLITIDVSSLPVDSADPCPASAALMDSKVSGGMFAAEYVDGNLLVVNENGKVYIVARDGAALAYANGLPNPVHGLVEDPGTLPQAAPPCPADALISVANNGYDSSLFAVDLESGALAFVNTVPFEIWAMELDPVSGQLIAESRRPEGQLWRIDACSGNIDSQLSRPNGPAAFRTLDIGRSGAAHARSGSDLHALDLVTGSSSFIGSGPFALSMTIRGGDVLHELPNVNETESIGFFSLAGYPAPNGSLPLVYGAGLETGQFRRVIALDTRFEDGALFGLLRRVDDSAGSGVTTALGNALVRIDESGNVTRIADLPAGASHLTVDPNPIFADGFE